MYILFHISGGILSIFYLSATAQICGLPAEIFSYIRTWNEVVSSSTHQERHSLIAEGILHTPQSSDRLERVRTGIVALQNLEIETRSPARIPAPGARHGTVPEPYLLTIESVETIDSENITVTVSFTPAPRQDIGEMGMPVRSARLLWILTDEGWRLQGRLLYS